MNNSIYVPKEPWEARMFNDNTGAPIVVYAWVSACQQISVFAPDSGREDYCWAVSADNLGIGLDDMVPLKNIDLENNAANWEKALNAAAELVSGKIADQISELQEMRGEVEKLRISGSAEPANKTRAESIRLDIVNSGELLAKILKSTPARSTVGRVYDQVLRKLKPGVKTIWLDEDEKREVFRAVDKYENRHGAASESERIKMQLAMTPNDYARLVENRSLGFIKNGAKVWYVYPAITYNPVCKGHIEDICEDGSVEIYDELFGSVKTFPQRIFAERPEAAAYWHYMT